MRNRSSSLSKVGALALLMSLVACSSDSNKTDASTAGLIDDDPGMSTGGNGSTGAGMNTDGGSDAGSPIAGIRANTGIASQLLANGTPETAARPSSIDLDYLLPSNGFSEAHSFEETQTSAKSFDRLGDVNGDGLPDFTITYSDRTLLIFGGTGNLDNLDLDNVTAEQGITLSASVFLIPVGDLNNDGVDDIAWHAFDVAVEQDTGARIVSGGNRDALAAALEDSLAGTAGTLVSNSIRVWHVRSIASAGDFNGDGFDDFLIGGFGFNMIEHDAPIAWVVYGHADIFSAEPIDVSKLTVDEGVSFTAPLMQAELDAIFDDTGTGFNTSIEGNVDINGDGIDDIAVGTHWFDWIAQQGETRTYVIYGATSFQQGTMNLRELDGTNGLRVTGASTPVETSVNAAGDIDGNGFDDLAINVEGEGMVLFGGTGISASVIAWDSPPAGSAMSLTTDEVFEGAGFVSKVGDLDGNGADELGIALLNGGGLIYFGDVDKRPSALNLDSPNENVATLRGMANSLPTGSANPLVALGDTNNDGIDDLGIGWNLRYYDAGLSTVPDVNGDGIEDVQIRDSIFAQTRLLRVLYGFGSAGFTGHLVNADDVQAVAIIEEAHFNEVVDAINTAGNYAVDALGNYVQGTGPSADACLASANINADAQVNSFNCDTTPLAFAFDWVGGRRTSGTAEGRFHSLALLDGVVQSMKYTSWPLPTSNPFGPANSAFFEYDANGQLVLTNTREDMDAAIPRQSCTIDVATRISNDDYAQCQTLINRLADSLNSIFSTSPTVDNVRLLP